MLSLIRVLLFSLLGVVVNLVPASHTSASPEVRESDCVTGRVTVASGETRLLRCLKIHTQLRAGWRYSGKLPEGETRVGVRIKEPRTTCYYLDFVKLRSLDLGSAYDITVVQVSGETIRGMWEGYFGGPGSTTTSLKDLPRELPTRPHWEAFEYFLIGMAEEGTSVKIPLLEVRRIIFIQPEAKQ